MLVQSLLLAVMAATSARAADCPVIKPQTRYPPPVAADGWSSRIISVGFDTPRSLAFDDDGRLLILDQKKGLCRYTFRDHGGSCLDFTETEILDGDTELSHGLAFHNSTVYASTLDNVYSWPYTNLNLSANTNAPGLGERTTLITGMGHDDGGHFSRTLLVSRDGSSIIVSAGSAGNIDLQAKNETTGRSQIRQFPLTGANVTFPYNWATDGRRLGWGLRNSVGIAEHPDGGLWSVENSVDNLHRRGVDIHQNNPAEELNYHGKVSDANDRGNYGYPSCVALWKPDGVPDLDGLTTGDQIALDANITNSTTAPTDAQCNQDFEVPRLAFQAHTAPLDIVFDSNGTTAYITFHGSWNSDEKVGYQIGAVDFANGQPTANRSSTSAVRSILSNKDISKCPDNCFRPTGMAWDAQGRLWMTSDSTGDLYVLVKGDDPFANSGAMRMRHAPAVVVVLGAVVLALVV